MKHGRSDNAVHVEPNLLLINGDCKGIVSQIPRKSISHICIDPPYNTSKTIQHGKGKGFETVPTRYHCVKFTDVEWTHLIATGFSVLKDGGRQFIFCNQTLQMQIESVTRQNKEWGMRKLMWRHNSGGALSTDARCSVRYTEKVVVEYIICVHLVGKFKNSSVFLKPRDRAHEDWLGEYDGGDVKPKALYCDVLKRYKPGFVLDYCMHKGVCGEAAFECGHSFIGIEIMNHLFEAARTRLQSRDYVSHQPAPPDLTYVNEHAKRPKTTHGRPGICRDKNEYPLQKRCRSRMYASLCEDQMEDNLYGNEFEEYFVQR